MSLSTATAVAHPNIAFIKYWGNQNDQLRIPSNGSISMNLDGLATQTTVTFNPALTADLLILNGSNTDPSQTQRVTGFLDIVRSRAKIHTHAQIDTTNNFPSGSGIASSASGFAALALAASSAAGLMLDETDLSRLARRGSGSACRSIPAGFTEWLPGYTDVDSYALSIAPTSHWDLVDIIVVFDQSHKKTGSTEGHALASTSALQAGRVAHTPNRLDTCRRSLLDRDFTTFADIIEQDCRLMHAVMMTSTPPLLYWLPATLDLIQRVPVWRKNGLPVAFTIDAGSNVHLITISTAADTVQQELQHIPGIQQTLLASPGGPAHLI